MQKIKEKAFQYIDDKKDDMMTLWKDLVNTDSGSENIAGVNAVAEKVKQALNEGGVTTRLFEFEQAGNMVFGEIPGSGHSPVLLLGHMDTVFKADEAQQRPFTITDGKAYGPGVLDMKGGLVIAVFVARALKEAGFNERPIKLLFAGDEEIAHSNSNAAEIFMQQAKGCIAAFDCETGFIDNSVVVGRKGTATFKVSVKGVESHAGNDPKRGRSAILEMAHKVIDIQNLTNWDKEYTFNVGTIKGGRVVNAVPGNCEAVVDIRYVDPAIMPELRELVQTTLSKTYIDGTSTVLDYMAVGLPPMQTTEGVNKLFALWSRVSEENNFGTPKPIKTGGGSDAAYTVLAGAPTLCAVGVKGGKNHSTDEFAVVDSLFERSKLLISTILRLNEMNEQEERHV
jgi:glutamate carboxypeptidase